MFPFLTVSCLLLHLVHSQYEGPQMNVLSSGYETVVDDQEGEDPVSATGGDQLGYQGDSDDQPGLPLVDPPNLTPPPTPPPHMQNAPQESLLNPGIKFPPQQPPPKDSPRRYVDPVKLGAPRLPPSSNTRTQPRKQTPKTRPRTDQPIPRPPLLEGTNPRPLVDPVNLGPPNVPIPRPSRYRPAPRVYVDPVNLGPPNVPVPAPGRRVNSQYGSNQPLVDPLRNKPLPLPEPPRLQVPPDCNSVPIPVPPADEGTPNTNYDLDYPPGVNGGDSKIRLAKALEALSGLQTQLFGMLAGLRRSAKVHGNSEFSPKEVKSLTDTVRSASNLMKKMRRKHRF